MTTVKLVLLLMAGLSALSAAAATLIVVMVDTRSRPAAKRVAAALIEIALLGATALAMLVMEGRG